eukprot:7615515-Alexandrium_andersonii.AAC.1
MPTGRAPISWEARDLVWRLDSLRVARALGHRSTDGRPSRGPVSQQTAWRVRTGSRPPGARP